MLDGEYPDWLSEQRGKAYRSPGYLNRNTIIRRYARHIEASGHRVTVDAVRRMLTFVDRGYSLKTDQISRALSPLYRGGVVQPVSTGLPVRVKDRVYRSARAAAEDQGISPQTVLNRVASARDEWKDWRREG